MSVCLYVCLSNLIYLSITTHFLFLTSSMISQIQGHKCLAAFTLWCLGFILF